MPERIRRNRGLARPGKPRSGAHPPAQLGQRGKDGASNCRARATCWGTTPLPSAVSCAGRPRPGVAVTQPGARPCIHSTKSARSRPAASVGSGAGWVSLSHRVMAAAYGPHRGSAPRPPATPPSRAAGPPPTREDATPSPGGGPGAPASLAQGLGSSDAAALSRAMSLLPRRWCGSVSPWGTVGQSTVVISPRLGTPGQCWARMREASGLTSTCQASVPPTADCTPREAAVSRAQRADQRRTRDGGLHVPGSERSSPGELCSPGRQGEAEPKRELRLWPSCGWPGAEQTEATRLPTRREGRRLFGAGPYPPC